MLLKRFITRITPHSHARAVGIGLLIASLFLIQGCAPVIVAGTMASAGASIVSDRRETGKLLEDQAIEISATDRIYGDRQIGKKVRVSVSSFNGVVLVTGEAPTAEMRKKIHDIVRPMDGVTELYNEVQVREPIPINNRTHDYWISSKVKGRLMAKRGFFTRTKVITSDGIVYLMGIATPNEIKEATDIAGEVNGTNRVIALFEIQKDGKSIFQRTEKNIAQNIDDTESMEMLKEEQDLSVAPEGETLPTKPVAPAIQVTSE